MKVLMFGWEFPPHISGGLGTACLGITTELSKLNVGITFVLPKISKEHVAPSIKFVGPQKVAEDVKKDEPNYPHLLRKIEVSSTLMPYLDSSAYAEYLEQTFIKNEGKAVTDKNKTNLVDISGGYGPDLMTEVHRYAVVGKHIAEKESFDVIHAHDWMTFLAAIEAKKVSGKPMIVHVHSTEFDRAGDWISTEVYCIEKYGMDMADRIITVSQRMKDILVNKYNQNPDKIAVVYNGVESPALQYLNKYISHAAYAKDKIVLFLGRITMQKGPEYFLEAAATVMKKMKNVRFVMAGAGDLTPKIIERMAELRLNERFHFTGFVDTTEREKLFALSDLYVMPSVSEPFGITPLEAMRHNIPIIISKQSGVAEILADVIKVDFWDVKKLSEAIIDVLTDEESSKKVAEKGQRLLKEITWGNAAKEILENYQQIVAAKVVPKAIPYKVVKKTSKPTTKRAKK